MFLIILPDVPHSARYLVIPIQPPGGMHRPCGSSSHDRVAAAASAPFGPALGMRFVRQSYCIVTSAVCRLEASFRVPTGLEGQKATSNALCLTPHPEQVQVAFVCSESSGCQGVEQEQPEACHTESYRFILVNLSILCCVAECSFSFCEFNKSSGKKQDD